jgi:hypothetical protein
MSAPPDAAPLGRVVATERRPSTPHEFHFWTALDAPVGIGSIVRVVATHPVAGALPMVYGVVTGGMAWSDLASPLDDVLGFDGDPSAVADAPTRRAELRLYTAAVLRQVPEEPLQPVSLGAVYEATADDVAVALRMEGYLRPEARTAVPIGVYRAGGTRAPVWLDADFLVGPEAAHVNLTGISGLATKTSAVEWLLASLFAHFPQDKGGIAAVCFNVKGPDLLFLDQPGELGEEDRAMYAELGVPAAPFADVTYYAPYGPKRLALATLRTHEALQHNVEPLTWGLAEVLQFAEVLLNKDDVDAKADALIDFIRERVAGQVIEADGVLSRAHAVRTFADLEGWFRDLLKGMEARNQDSWRTHHVATIRKIRNRLGNIALRCAGLVADHGEPRDLPWGQFRDRSVLVVDVANLEEDAQDLIFARIISTLREQLERGTLGVKQVVVFVDELNRYAAADGPDTYVRRMLLDVAERGRYLGLVLASAQQFRSQVHRRIVGNAATALYGRMDGEELATPGYQVLAPAIKTRLATLDKGQLMVRHPHFGQPVFVRFPRPAVMRGRDGIQQFPLAAEPGLEEALVRTLRRLDARASLAWAQDLAALHDERELLAIRDAALRERPADVKAFFAARLRAHAPAREAAAPPRGPRPVRPVPDDDPYGG